MFFEKIDKTFKPLTYKESALSLIDALPQDASLNEILDDLYASIEIAKQEQRKLKNGGAVYYTMEEAWEIINGKCLEIEREKEKSC